MAKPEIQINHYFMSLFAVMVNPPYKHSSFHPVIVIVQV